MSAHSISLAFLRVAKVSAHPGNRLGVAAGTGLAATIGGVLATGDAVAPLDPLEADLIAPPQFPRRASVASAPALAGLA